MIRNITGVVLRRAKLLSWVAALLMLAFLLIPKDGSAIANSISQGFQTSDTSLRPGMAVALDTNENNQRFVTAATAANSANFVGIITTVDDNVVSLRDSSSDVLVTTVGEVAAFVSDLDGAPKAGDPIAISPLRGILAGGKGVGTRTVIGVALEDFPQSGNESRTINTEAGEQRTINVGRMDIQISQNFAQDVIEAEQQNQSFLVVAGESISGKPVGQIQVIAALLVLLIVMIVEGSIIYGAIHSTIVALGRNPLSKKAVFKQLLQVSWLALLVLAFGFGIIYVLLWI